MQKQRVCVLICGLPRSIDLVMNNIIQLFDKEKYDISFTICSSVEKKNETEYLNQNIYDLLHEDKLANIKNILLLETDNNTEYRNSVNYFKKVSLGLNILSRGYDFYIVIRSDCMLFNIDFLDKIEEDKLYFSSNHMNIFTKDISEKINEYIIITKNFDALRHLRDLYDYVTQLHCINNNYANIVMYKFINMYANVTHECLDIQYKLILSKCNIIAVSGDSGSGKTTLMKHLMRLFPDSNLINFETDRYHKWERGNEQYKTITHLNPEANYLELMSDDIYNLKIGNDIYQVDYDHNTGKFTNKQLIESKENIILCGLHTLYDQKINNIIDIKVFMDTDRELIKKWKIARDVTERGHSVEKIIQQLDSRKEDYYKYIDGQKENADIIIHFYEEFAGLQLTSIGQTHPQMLKCKIIIRNTKIINKMMCELLKRNYKINFIENKHIFFDLTSVSQIYQEPTFEYFEEMISIFMMII